MRSAPPRCLHAAGFTLLEVMVAMLLLAVIVTASVSLLFSNIRGWDGLVSDSERAFDASLINDRVTAILRQLSPLVWQTGEGRRLAFDGQPDSLHFISQAPQQYRAGGLFEYLLVEETDSENRRGLVLYYAPYRPGQTRFMLPEGGQRRLLFADTGGVSFAFHGTKDRSGNGDWWERWESAVGGYPEMVRMQFAGVADAVPASIRYYRILTPVAADRVGYGR